MRHVMEIPSAGFFKKISLLLFLIPMIPAWGPKRRIPQPSSKDMELDFEKLPREDVERAKECAICRRGRADYEHSCGVAFHKVCIEQYFDAISKVDGAERICPHCYAPMPFDLDSDKEATIEVAPLSEEFYNQYLELSDEFSLALIDGRIMDISVFLNSPSGDQYYVNVDFSNYPNKPTFSFSDDLLVNLENLNELMEELGDWDPEFPPRLVDTFHKIESRITSKKAKETEPQEMGSMEPDEEKKGDESALREDTKKEFVEVFPEEEIVEVVPEDSKVSKEETYEVEEILPATFFELDSMPSTEFIKEARSADEFENEEAIQQYLNLSNSFSVELESDEIYNVIVYLS
ncbi:MAG: E3 ubiquitin protein ligase, partial [Thermoplasmata archaeon]